MSNPLVFIPVMDRSLTLAVLLTGSVLLITIPWVRAPRITWPVMLFLGWLLLSAAWSIEPAFTVAAWAQTAAIAAVAMTIGANVSARVLAAGFALGALRSVGRRSMRFTRGCPGPSTGGRMTR
jgi:hypothetical protein